MYRALRVHFAYIVSKKTITIIFSSLLASTLLFWYYTDPSISQTLVMQNSNYYKNEYIYESISYIKLVLVMFSVFLTIEAFIILKYDCFLLSRISKTKYIVSKVFALMILNTSVSVILVMIMWIVGLFNTTYLFSGDIFFILFIDMALFALYYTSLSVFMILHINNLFILITVLIGYFVSSSSIDYLADVRDISDFSYIIQVIFIDYSRYLNIGYSFLYSKIFIVAIMGLLVVNCIRKYIKNDA